MVLFFCVALSFTKSLRIFTILTQVLKISKVIFKIKTGKRCKLSKLTKCFHQHLLRCTGPLEIQSQDSHFCRKQKEYNFMRRKK